jgi:alpha-glucoside transport system permease protein
VYPTVQTFVYSFANAQSTEFVGFDNYVDLLGSSSFRNTLFNTFLWILLAPAGAIILGLLIATLADRLKPRGEKLSKSLIFLPMAIGGVSAAAIWRFVYASNPANENQIGLLNGIVTAFGGEPVNWLQISTFRLNSLLLIVMFLWLQAGFAMVLLSAAIKGVPTETLEAARLDGAGEGAIFFRIVVPQIRTTLITVFITVLIGVLKTFDIVYVMTNGNFNTNVIAVDFFNQLFTNNNAGYAAAIVVMLLIIMIPILVFQVRQFRAEEAAR